MHRLACLLALSLCASARAADAPIAVPWQPGNAASFQMGAREEGGARAEHGTLPVTIVRPDGAGPFPFVVLLHGCGGLRAPAMWTQWINPWSELFRRNGVGTAIVDSFGPRGVEQVCRGNVAAWAARRADDAYSVRAWLAQQSFVAADRIAVMGMSNGGRTVLAALRSDRKQGAPFRAGVALYPGCQSDVTAQLQVPLLVLIGRGDAVTPAAACEQMQAAQPAGAPLQLVLFPYAPHTYDMNLPDRTVLGMQLGHDAQAAAETRDRVIAFLAAHGIGSTPGQGR
jgi:dienelactone hydrolase